jgi:hypothetical protein
MAADSTRSSSKQHTREDGGPADRWFALGRGRTMIERNPSCYDMIDHVAKMLTVKGRRLRKLYMRIFFYRRSTKFYYFF